MTRGASDGPRVTAPGADSLGLGLPPAGPPRSEAELLARANALAGRALGELADDLGLQMPPDTTRAKGWVGQLVEDALGAAAGTRPVPDFEALAIELKTVPIDPRGLPREATYVTTLPLRELTGTGFAESSLAQKLARVLFVPVEAHPALPLPVRRLGTPLLWRPEPADRAQLEADWRLFRDRIGSGAVDAIGPNLGVALQVRPKGADARDTTWTTDPEGRAVRTMRRGLYLRPSFVRALFERHFLMPGGSP